MLRIAITIALGIGVAIFFVGCDYQSPTEIKQQMETSLPAGTSKKDVILFLDENGFEHSAGFKPELYYEKSKKISAVAPGKKYGILTTARVYVTLQFNEEDRLVEIQTREVKTGL